MKRFGVAGFLFFLVKGLAWLLVPIVVYWAANCLDSVEPGSSLTSEQGGS